MRRNIKVNIAELIIALIFLTIMMIIKYPVESIFIIMILVFIFIMIKNRINNFIILDNVSMTKIKECKAIIKSIGRLYPVYNSTNIKERLNKVYYAVYMGLAAGEPDLFKEYVSERAFKNFKRNIEIMDNINITKIYDKFELKNFEIISLIHHRNFYNDSIWIVIKETKIEYAVYIENNDLIDGNKKDKDYIEYWKFILKDKKWILDEIRQQSEVTYNNFNIICEE